MALSEHDQIILNELELSLRAGGARSSSASHPRRSRPHADLATVIGLLIVGVVAIAVGLGMQDQFGSGLGVVGFVSIVFACWSVVRRGSPARGRWSRIAITQWKTAQREAADPRPPHHLEGGQR